MLAGLRASLAGLPFLPTRGAQGSDVSRPRCDMRDVTCPYTGESLFAAPAIRPDVALVHAEDADAHGNVPRPAPPRLPVRLGREHRRAPRRG